MADLFSCDLTTLSLKDVATCLIPNSIKYIIAFEINS
jgi:hypothetical protein